MKAGRIAWSIVGLLSLSVATRAGPVTWEFGGVVTSVYDPEGLFGGVVSVGTPFSGYYTFESDTPPQTRAKEDPRRMSMMSPDSCPRIPALVDGGTNETQI